MRAALLVVLLAGCGDDGGTEVLPDAGPDAAVDAGGGGDGGTAWQGRPFEFQQIAWDGAERSVTALGFLPGSMELLALEKDGTVLHFALEGDSARSLGSFEVPGVHSEEDCGLISLAFDPDFATNRFLYLGYCLDMFESGIFRVTFDPSDYGAIAATTQEILVTGDPGAARPWHNVGAIGFDDGGTMWALFGDKTVQANGQSLDDDLGAMLRIVPGRDPGAGGYTPAPDNPFAAAGGSPDVYAIGLRSPWRGILDSQGRWWIGDVGSDFWEEVNLVTAPGQNFGWATVEGPCAADCDGFTDPLFAWERGGDEPYIDDDPLAEPVTTRVVWVGPEVTDRGEDRYDGQLTGRVLFGEFCVGFVRVAELDDEDNVVLDAPLGHLANASAMVQADDGYVYVATYGSCVSGGDPHESRLYRLRLE